MDASFDKVNSVALLLYLYERRDLPFSLFLWWGFLPPALISAPFLLVFLAFLSPPKKRRGSKRRGSEVARQKRGGERREGGREWEAPMADGQAGAEGRGGQGKGRQEEGREGETAAKEKEEVCKEKPEGKEEGRRSERKERKRVLRLEAKGSHLEVIPPQRRAFKGQLGI